MAKRTENKSRITYSVRIDPELIKLLKHVAVDENRSIGELLEEGIGAVLKKRRSTGNASVPERIKAKFENSDIDDEQFDIPGFLRKHTDS